MSDLPVVPIGRGPCTAFALAGEANQYTDRRVGKGALAPCHQLTLCGHAVGFEYGETLCPAYALRDLAGRGNVDAVSRILSDLVPHRAHRKSEHARCVGAIAVAARQRLQHELALDRLDRGADQHRHDLVG